MRTITLKQVHIMAVTFAALVPLLMAVAITAVTPSGTISPQAGDVTPAWDEENRTDERRFIASNKYRTWRHLSE